MYRILRAPEPLRPRCTLLEKIGSIVRRQGISLRENRTTPLSDLEDVLAEIAGRIRREGPRHLTSTMRETVRGGECWRRRGCA